MAPAMSPSTSFRCAACAEPLETAAPLCARCAANPAPAGLPARFAAYDPDRRRAPLYHFFSGMRFFLGALPYALRTGGIKRHVAVPIVLTVVLLVVLLVGGVAAAHWLLGPTGPNDVARFSRTLFEVVVIAALLIGAYLIFFPLARVLLAPFADKISERVEALALGQSAEAGFDVGSATSGAAHSLVEAVKMLGFQLVVTVPLLLVPLAGAPLAVLASVFFNGLGTMDIAMGRKRMRLGEKLRLARAHLAFVLGLGTAVYVVLLIPVVNLLAIPLGAVAATMAFLRFTLPRRAARPDGATA
jgi:CysZ protein